ncbi:hypothetical protein KI387_014905, partial [Taxus chinensis]
MERRRLAIILSHLSVNTNRRRSCGDCGHMVSGALDREGCSGKDGDVINTDEIGVCCCENSTGSSNSVVKAKKLCVENEEGCEGKEYDVEGGCNEKNNGIVQSHMTRGRGIVTEDGKKCVFCDIIRGRAPALKLYEDETCLCILDINPLSHGHSLIIPKSHFSSLEVTPPAVAAAMCAVVPVLGNAIMKATCC